MLHASSERDYLEPKRGESFQSVLRRTALEEGRMFIKPTPDSMLYSLEGVSCAKVQDCAHAKKKLTTDELIIKGLALGYGFRDIIDESIPEAIKVFNTVIKRKPSDLTASLHLGILILMESMHDEVADFGKKDKKTTSHMLKLYDHAWAGYTDHLAISLTLIRREDPTYLSDPEMLEALQYMATIKPSSIIHFLMAEIYESTNTMQALIAYRQATLLQDNYFEAWSNMGVLLERCEKDASVPHLALGLSSSFCFEKSFEINSRRGADYYAQALMSAAQSSSDPKIVEMYAAIQSVLTNPRNITPGILLTRAEFYAIHHPPFKCADYEHAILALNEYLASGDVSVSAFQETYQIVKKQIKMHMPIKLEQFKEAFRGFNSTDKELKAISPDFQKTHTGLNSVSSVSIEDGDIEGKKVAEACDDMLEEASSPKDKALDFEEIYSAFPDLDAAHFLLQMKMG